MYLKSETLLSSHFVNGVESESITCVACITPLNSRHNSLDVYLKSRTLLSSHIVNMCNVL